MSADLRAGGMSWVDEFVLALAARGVTDRWVVQQRVWVEQLLAFAACPVWEVQPGDVDGWLVAARGRGTGPQTRGLMAQAVYRFYAFVETRYGAWVREAAGRRVVCPVDEFAPPAHSRRRPGDGRGGGAVGRHGVHGRRRSRGHHRHVQRSLDGREEGVLGRAPGAGRPDREAHGDGFALGLADDLFQD
ncbi:hypothetical protein ABZX90_43645 [Streptomyces sp. NPDC002935]|uniref:hypothetical protein n=1 Tax=Streptomyces sp. NPDC002935 TaxID=3154545 RepID=UPI0033BA5F54